MAESQEAQVLNLAALSVKLPDFWQSNVRLWFTRADAQFSLRRITDEQTKFDHLICALPESVHVKVQGAVTDPGPTPYTTLKDAVIKAFSQSEESRIKSLLNDVEMGDRKPSEYFHALKSTAGTSVGVTEVFLLNLWKDRIPPNISTILEASNQSDTETLTKMADKIHETLKFHPAINSISHSASKQSEITDLASLRNEIAELRKALGDRSREKSRWRLRERSRGRSKDKKYREWQPRSPINKNPNPSFCIYHNEFGKNARNCRNPCSFKDSSNSGNRD